MRDTMRFNPVDFGFEWTPDGWYRWDAQAARKAALAARTAWAKARKAEGLQVRLGSNPGQLITRGGIGSGHPQIEQVVTVFYAEVVSANAVKVGERVEVRNYAAAPGLPESWEGGYVVRSVEFEDVVVERCGQAFAIGNVRVRREVLS